VQIDPLPGRYLLPLSGQITNGQTEMSKQRLTKVKELMKIEDTVLDL